MSKLDKDTVIDNFTQAYTKAHGKAPSVEAKGGWYSVDGGKNIRLAQIEEMTAELASTKAEPKVAKVPKQDAPAQKTVATKSAPVKKVMKKKQSGKSFSVKDFYTQQILEANPGVKAPR